MNQLTPDGTLITADGSNCAKNEDAQRSIIALTFADDPEKYTGDDSQNPDETPDEEKCDAGEIWYDGACVPPASCPDETFQDMSGQCISCTNTDPYIHSSKFHCLQCSQRVYLPQFSYCLMSCNANQFASDSSFSCVDCDNPSRYHSSQDECNKCGNKRIFSDGYCYKKLSCDKTQMAGYDGNCYECDYNSVLLVKDTLECQKCSNRWMLGRWNECIKDHQCASDMFDTTEGCKSCNDTGRYSTTQENCNKCLGKRVLNSLSWCALNKDCSAGTFNSEGSCVSCTSKSYYDIPQSECDKCGNVRIYEDNECKLNTKCAANTFQDMYNTCQSCDSTTVYITTGDKCDDCGSKRFFVGITGSSSGYCAKSHNCGKGLSDTPYHNCQSCDNKDRFDTSAEECSKCGSKRIFEEGICYYR